MTNITEKTIQLLKDASDYRGATLPATGYPIRRNVRRQNPQTFADRYLGPRPTDAVPRATIQRATDPRRPAAPHTAADPSSGPTTDAAVPAASPGPVPEGTLVAELLRDPQRAQQFSTLFGLPPATLRQWREESLSLAAKRLALLTAVPPSPQAQPRSCGCSTCGSRPSDSMADAGRGAYNPHKSELDHHGPETLV